MTTHIGSRSWTYYENGQYPCTCWFCKVHIETTEARLHSPKPTSLYACAQCDRENGILPKLYPETGQERLEKASEVPVDAQTPSALCNDAPKAVWPSEARETAIKRAHEENMESARQTRDIIALLVTAINQLTKAIRTEGMLCDEPVTEAEPDMREAEREADD